jgi:molybdopterin-guanine dinucleotide biosynthesis protein A
MAGGRNTRYGAIKALEPVGGIRIIDRVMDALKQVTPALVLIANDPVAYCEMQLPMRPDARPDLGAIGGLLTALRWAVEEQRPGLFAVACDMPFLSVDLLRELQRRAALQRADVIAPESGSRRGLEPLCAYYSTRCLPAVESAIERADLRLVGFHNDVAVERIPLDVVQHYGDPDVMFLNVNTRDERERAERLLAERA